MRKSSNQHKSYDRRHQHWFVNVLFVQSEVPNIIARPQLFVNSIDPICWYTYDVFIHVYSYTHSVCRTADVSGVSHMACMLCDTADVSAV